VHVHYLKISQGSFTLLPKFPFVYKQKKKTMEIGFSWTDYLLTVSPSSNVCMRRNKTTATQQKNQKKRKTFFDLAFFVLVVVVVVVVDVVVVVEDLNKKEKRVERS